MAFTLTSSDYAEYLRRAYAAIHVKGDYVTELDLATGDGDHWANLDMGFSKLNEKADSYESMDIVTVLKDIGMTMMSVIGGSSGLLYGSAYISASVAVKGKKDLNRDSLYCVLEAMLNAIMKHGKSQEGFKTMIDSLAPAVHAYKSCLDRAADDEVLCGEVAAAALAGAENTKNMPAIRGRAVYQADKGVGHLDPGAVTMSYQIEELMKLIREKIDR